jgi:hypothetical protein
MSLGILIFDFGLRFAPTSLLKNCFAWLLLA